MSSDGVNSQGLSNVAETLLIPLYFRAIESQRPDALMRDEKAVALINQIHYDFSQFKFEEHDKVGLVLRTREFDRFARDFLARFPEAAVVHVGCGLDTRFDRVDNGKVEWYDLDLPEVIDLRRKLIGGEGDHYHLLSCSVFDRSWLDEVGVHRRWPFLFLTEGVLQYFEEAEVKSLVLMLLERFPGSELVCDAVTPYAVWLNNLKISTTKISARYHWGLKQGKDLESWGNGIRLLDEWFYFDNPEPRLSSSRWMRYIPLFAKASGIFHYRLGKMAAT